MTNRKVTSLTAYFLKNSPRNQCMTFQKVISSMSTLNKVELTPISNEDYLTNFLNYLEIIKSPIAQPKTYKQLSSY